MRRSCSTMTPFEEEAWLISLIEDECEEEEKKDVELINSGVLRDLYVHIWELYCITALLILTIIFHHVSLPYGTSLTSSSLAAPSRTSGEAAGAHLDRREPRGGAEKILIRPLLPRPQAAPHVQEVGTGVSDRESGGRYARHRFERVLEKSVRPVGGLFSVVRSPPRAVVNADGKKCDLVSPFWKGGHSTPAEKGCLVVVVPDGFFLNVVPATRDQTRSKNITKDYPPRLNSTMEENLGNSGSSSSRGSKRGTSARRERESNSPALGGRPGRKAENKDALPTQMSKTTVPGTATTGTTAARGRSCLLCALRVIAACCWPVGDKNFASSDTNNNSTAPFRGKATPFFLWVTFPRSSSCARPPAPTDYSRR